ncbi:MAG: hypothetical protein ACOY3K_02270 [Candidatus Omnitrophota bacterium]
MVTTLLFLGFLFLCWHYLEYFLGKISWNIFGGWDARYFWNLKAKFLFRDPALWRGMFSPILDWAHPDYPLFLPGSIAWGWNLLGEEFLIWPAVVDLVFFISLLLLLLWYAGSFHSWTTAWIAGSFLLSIPNYAFWSTTQYADIPLAFLFTAAALFASLGLRRNSPSLFWVAGLFAGLSAWMKNEGLFFIGWLGFLIVLHRLIHRDVAWKHKLSTLFQYGLGTLLGLAAVLYAKCCLGLAGGEYLGSGRGFQDYWQAIFSSSEKTKFIALCFWVFKISFSQWSLLWILFLMSPILWGHRLFQDSRWFFPLLVLLIEFGYFVILHVAPSEISFQIRISLHRLLLHTGVLALISIVELAGPLVLPSFRKTRD